jgi:hypothetical protein
VTTQTQITHRMPAELLERMDCQRGPINRNAWMNLVIQKALDTAIFDFRSPEDQR